MLLADKVAIWRVVEPLLTRKPGLPQNACQKSRRYILAVRVGYCEAQLALEHEQMLPAGVWSLETVPSEPRDELGVADRRQPRYQAASAPISAISASPSFGMGSERLTLIRIQPSRVSLSSRRQLSKVAALAQTPGSSGISP